MEPSDLIVQSRETIMACKTFAKKIDTDQIRQETASLAENIAAQAAKAAKEAQLRAQPVVEEARTRVVEDYVPAAHRAAVAAQNAAGTEGTLTERAQRIAVAAKNAALEIPEVPVKKKHPVLKTLGWLALAGAAVGAAYVVWRRSQPVEDPWAEEYWADAAEDEAVEEGISAPVVPAE